MVLLKTSLSSAANLCDSDCLLSISFPSGGSIAAIEPLTISFGNSGLLDTSGSVTAYVDGETLSLNAGDSISFGTAGSFDIGTGGNIAFTDLRITTDGDLMLSATGGAERVQIQAASKLTLSGGGYFEVGSSIEVEGSLEVGPGSSIHVVGSGMPAGCEISGTSGATLSAGPGIPVTIDNASSCNDIYTAIGSLTGSGSIQLIDTATNTNFGTLHLVSNSAANTVGSLTLSPSDDGLAGASGIDLIILMCALWLLHLCRNHKRNLTPRTSLAISARAEIPSEQRQTSDMPAATARMSRRDLE